MKGFVYAILAFLPTLAPAETKTVTWTGWFSDSKCAVARASSGTFTATNPECAKTCIEKGAAAVFISEQAKAVFKVKDYSNVIDDLAYRVEINAKLDDASRTLSIEKVTRLEYNAPACYRPKMRAPKE